VINSDDVPILSVQVSQERVPRALPNCNMVWDARCRVQFGPWKVPEGVEVYAVDGSSNEAEKQLLHLSNCLFGGFWWCSAVLTIPNKAPKICDAEVIFRNFASPVGLPVDVEDMMLRLQPL
jgi:hypothetical protein